MSNYLTLIEAVKTHRPFAVDGCAYKDFKSGNISLTREEILSKKWYLGAIDTNSFICAADKVLSDCDNSSNAQHVIDLLKKELGL